MSLRFESSPVCLNVLPHSTLETAPPEPRSTTILSSIFEAAASPHSHPNKPAPTPSVTGTNTQCFMTPAPVKEN